MDGASSVDGMRYEVWGVRCEVVRWAKWVVEGKKALLLLLSASIRQLCCEHIWITCHCYVSRFPCLGGTLNRKHRKTGSDPNFWLAGLTAGHPLCTSRCQSCAPRGHLSLWSRSALDPSTCPPLCPRPLLRSLPLSLFPPLSVRWYRCFCHCFLSCHFLLNFPASLRPHPTRPNRCRPRRADSSSTCCHRRVLPGRDAIGLRDTVWRIRHSFPITPASPYQIKLFCFPRVGAIL